MTMDPTRKQQRREKRDLKQAGSQRRRRLLKRALEENPEEAHEAEVDFGRLSTAPLNGVDRDSTRRKPGAEPE